MEKGISHSKQIMPTNTCSLLYIPMIPMSPVISKASFHTYERIPLNGQNVPFMNHTHLILSSNLFPFWLDSYPKLLIYCQQELHLKSLVIHGEKSRVSI